MSKAKAEVGQATGTLERADGFMSRWVSGWNPYDPQRLKNRKLQPIAVEESGVRKRAAQIFLLFFALFFIWASTAPLDAGVSVVGSVVVMGNRKAVQHPSGGVVQEILVKEGDEVKQGDILLRVNPLKTDAQSTGIELQYINLLASESRLKSERDGSPSIRWTEELVRKFPKRDPRVEEAKNLQAQLFNSRRAEFESQVASLREQIAGLTASYQSRQLQSRSIDEEMRNSRDLAKDGYVPQTQANQAERAKSDIDASIANTQAEIARVKLQISQLRTTFLKDVDTQLQEIQKTRDAVFGQMGVAQFDRNLAQVRAPVSGNVVGLKVFTAGGVITSAQVLMEIVPKDESLAVDVQIPTNLIDKVRVGMLADMRFVAFNQTTTPVIEGELKVVGADKLAGTTPGSEYYMAQIQTTPEGLQKLGELQVQPGMPVDVVIKSGERTFMSYLLKPLSDKLALAFKQ
ncbi:MAG: HlyD family type I secretion periplasmic adaptor subunit [Rhodoferax sp.]|nr:HlyD family type I secretion periplasmic adaptor subunit [Rhodoferax sp.]